MRTAKIVEVLRLIAKNPQHHVLIAMVLYRLELCLLTETIMLSVKVGIGLMNLWQPATKQVLID
ncbi:hypothetical protein [Paenibacillus sp. 1_12]|uniref:hypothetical protein n=1 Tax=Paenibacillus sp. 1_12 TaxID=1566278 RepID=UPI000B80B89E|nr:hypothetical protein [Paenibacillus sp. 1_12]